MQKLPFSHNWNGKLFLDHFGTVRLNNPEKYSIGNKLEVELKNVSMGIVKVEAVRTFHYKHIRDVLSYLDCGKPAHYLADLIKRFYANSTNVDPELLLDHIVLGYTHRNIANHAAILKDWWQQKLQEQPLSVQQEIFN